jgi:zinc protease
MIVPLGRPALGQSLWLPSSQTAKQEAPLPTAEQILERYAQASGGRAAVERVTSRVWKGSRVGADGVLVPEEVYAKAPNKLLTITSYPKQVFRTGFDGARGWAKSNQDTRELPAAVLAQLRREAEFYKETRLKELYSKLSVGGRETIGGREAYVVEAAPAGGGDTEKLYFDAETGLLVRKYSEMKTVLGQFPTQTDYEDFREVDGVKLPFSIRWSIPGRSWGRKITEVKQNIPLDDAQFNPPAGGN